MKITKIVENSHDMEEVANELIDYCEDELDMMYSDMDPYGDTVNIEFVNRETFKPFTLAQKKAKAKRMNGYLHNEGYVNVMVREPVKEDLRTMFTLVLIDEK